MTETTTTHSGHGDDFTVTATCSCGASHTATLEDHGDFSRAFREADDWDAAHQLARH
jgi:hypothetical protein